jgi:uncharacterized Zn-finger protein
VLFHLMRLMGLSSVAEPHVALIQRAGLGSYFPDHEERALWIVPSPGEIEIFVREAPAQRGPRTGVPAPGTGTWAVPSACPRKETTFVNASFPCPHCKVHPRWYRELSAQGALVCPECGRSFVPRRSRF